MKSHGTGDHLGTMEYVSSMLKQLTEMARNENCDMLAYLIEMAHLEASDLARGRRPSSAKVNERDSAA